MNKTIMQLWRWFKKGFVYTVSLILINAVLFFAVGLLGISIATMTQNPAVFLLLGLVFLIGNTILIGWLIEAVNRWIR